MRLTKPSQVFDPLDELGLRGDNLDGQKLFCSLSSHLTSHIGELLERIIPSLEDRLCSVNGTVKRGVVEMQEPLSSQHPYKLIVEVARDGLHEG